MLATRLTPALAVVVLVGAALATATPAAAGTPPPPVARTPEGPVRSSDFVTNVAGYVASFPAATRRSVVATFVVPAVTCQPQTVDPLFVDVGLYGTTTGTTTFDYAAAGLTITCTQGVPYYEAAVSTQELRSAGAVSPGDSLTVRITVSAGNALATITDTTSGGTFRTTGNGVAATSAQASVQGGFGDAAFPRFGAVKFLGVRIDGAALGTFSPSSFDQGTPDGRIQLETTPLNSNLSFGVRWRGQP